MISMVDLHDSWEITKALYGDDRPSETAPAIVRLFVEAADNGGVSGTGASRNRPVATESAIAA